MTLRQAIVADAVREAQARIYGLELKGGVDLGALSESMAGWSVRGAAAWSRGDDRTDDVPLDSVDPLTATLGVAYASEAWGAELAGRFVARRDRLSPPPTGTSYFESPGYGVLDLYAHWNFAPGARVNVGVFNLADKTYWPAGGIGLASSTSAVLDRFTAPGRNYGASLSIDW